MILWWFQAFVERMLEGVFYMGLGFVLLGFITKKLL